MNNIIPIEKSIYIAIPSSYNTTQRGSFFEKLCAQILSKQSYAIESMEIRKSGMEVDIEARHTPSDKKVYVECKFYNNKYTLESSILDLCFSQSFRGGHDAIALFSTVKLGKDAQAVLEDYKNSKVDFSFYDAQEILNSLIVSGLVKDVQVKDLKPNYSNATLLIHPEISPHWLYQEIEDGTPTHLVYQSLGESTSYEKLRKILDDENKFLGLDLKKFNSEHEIEQNPSFQTKEIVSNIILADDIMDYKPCRPQDFVGREDIQKEIWDFLDAVREHRTDCRILSLTGSSGNGKSSLVANLAHRFKNIKWKNKFFLYPVDIRSARGPRFVAEVVTKAFNTALKEKFIDLNISFKVENINEILNGTDFRLCDEYLIENNKVLIIFFDQFEEVFMKEDLFSLFEAFKRFGLDVAGERTNLVLGFSWRNGIFLGDDNPAYSLWNELKDHRTEKRLKLFDEKDSSQMISTFERSESIKLNTPLKRRLIQQAQGFPWLLKKLCIHLFKKINEGISQELLLINQLQIKTLFDEDLERPNREVDCLKYVALNSPVDRYQTTQEFGEGTVSRLISDRLLIKTGEKISVYWDVFRDYLKTNEAPIISWAYMPTTTISSAIKLLNLINETPSPTYERLIESSSYSRGTLQNIIMDLQSFSLVEKLDDGVFHLTTSLDQAPKKIRDQLVGHAVYIRCLEQIKLIDTGFIKLNEVNEIIDDIYAKSKNPNQYQNRILSWLKFAGLVNQVGQSLRLHKNDTYSPEYGSVSSKTRDSLFVAASTFENATLLIKRLRTEVEIDSQEKGLRNVILDLVNLGICTRKGSFVTLLPSKHSDLDAETFLAIHVNKADTILLLQNLQQKLGDDLDHLAIEMAKELNKDWLLSSGQRYVRALIRYNSCAQKRLL
ncbi:restriction endonuclease [Acinetobacter sp. YH16057]|uniref:nSTAND1 domain-containing NTPase n=1 Tax=Acinetobacter sp. YH16057 TaxID=2601195 RepID=UPI0015D3CF57|nr:restriction endonuclease [Acinetobacter sp. YH16057]